MKTFDKSEPIPAAAITLATGNSPEQPILFTTQQFCEQVNGKKVKNDWVISHLECSILRDWHTSTFQVILKCDLPSSLAPVPPLPNVSKWRGGKYPYLDREDEIRIYMGYIPSVDTVISSKMLDEIPFDVGDLRSDPKRPLCPVFWGFIDKVDFIGNERGVQVVLTGRDRMRVLQDTRLIAITSFTGQQFTKSGGIEDVGNGGGFRPNILLDIANAAVGNANLPGQATVNPDGTRTPAEESTARKCWKRVLGESEGALLYAARTKKVKGAYPVQVEPPPDIARWVLQGCFKHMDQEARPRFHRWVEKPPLTKNDENSIFELFDKTPMECINFLAKTEERPIDVFCSHVNGDFCFVPRILDMSGFEDPVRFYRTYFFRGFPDKSCPPHPGQMIKSLRTVSTSLGTFNRFVVVNAGTNANQATVLANLSAAISYLPLPLQDRSPLPPCRTQIISDDSADMYGNAQAGALIVAMSMARVHGRDLNVAQMTILGDPTFFPGEAVKLWGTLLHDHYASTPLADRDAQIQSDFAKTKDWREGVAQSYDNVAFEEKEVDIPVRYGSDGLPIPPTEQEIKQSQRQRVATNLMPEIGAGGTTSPQIDQLAAEVMSKGRTDASGGTDADRNLLPVYKVRTVKHTLTAVGPNAGFTTEIAMAADY